jgi:hypothetical protein
MQLAQWVCGDRAPKRNEVDVVVLGSVHPPPPMPTARNQGSEMARIARHSTTPIATGERLGRGLWLPRAHRNGAVDILQTDINHVGGIRAVEGRGGGEHLEHLHGASCLRGTHLRYLHLACGFCHAQLSGSGNLQLGKSWRQGEDLGRMVWLPRHAHGRWTRPSPYKAGLGLRAERSLIK